MDALVPVPSALMKQWLVSSVGIIGIAWYYICIFDMGLRPTPAGKQAPGFRQFQSLSVTTISVSLATYVGYVIGLPAQSTAPSPGHAMATQTSLAILVAAAEIPKVQTVSDLQFASAVAYVLSLVVAVAFYARCKDETEPALTGLAKSLLGFVAGVFSVALNLPS